ncbi:MAG: uracil-DNA glycosylase [Candidatus Shapirobacteria bacterium]|nr:uracil-DNA glycosylase [Candidatus Shapirobacteria bacterium]
MEVKIEKSWKEVLQKEFDEKYFEELTEFVKSEYKNSTVYPSAKFIFNAFELTPFDKVKVVILGQDPYHGKNQANGLAFSVNNGTPIPPSLANIYKEIESDMGERTKSIGGNLENWAKQGVLMLNATLTVKAHMAGSHQNKGWEKFTDAVVKILSEQKENLVFILWGSYAQKKGSVINENKHMVIRSVHPSPLSAYNGFFGSKPFSQTNAYLIFSGKEPIEW